MALSLFSYRGMPLNKILATNESDNASGITKVDNPLESYFNEQTKYKLLTTTAINVIQDLTNVIYSIPGLSSLAGQNYSAYYDEYIPRPIPYPIDLTDAKACFSYITVILIGGSGTGATNLAGNGSSGGCVIYQINLKQMGGNNIEIEVGNNNPTANGLRAGDTILYLKYPDNTRDQMAIAAGGQSASGTQSGSTYACTVYNNYTAYKSSFSSDGKSLNDPNTVYTINGYRQLLGFQNVSTNPYIISINNNTWPIFYENPDCYGGTQGPYAVNTTPTPYAGYARVYYML